MVSLFFEFVGTRSDRSGSRPQARPVASLRHERNLRGGEEAICLSWPSHLPNSGPFPSSEPDDV